MFRNLFLVACSLFLTGGLVWSTTTSIISTNTNTAFAARNNSNFDTMMQVLTHKRCLNCHPSDGIPRQGEDSHKHYFGIARGENDEGFDATKCNTCHQDENNDFSGVPGAPQWKLAPDKMRWSGLTRVQIAESILDPKRNGKKSHDDIIRHLTEHKLVVWAWAPGIDTNGKLREQPPVPLEEYKAAVKQWFADGAQIPKK